MVNTEIDLAPPRTVHISAEALTFQRINRSFRNTSDRAKVVVRKNRFKKRHLVGQTLSEHSVGYQSGPTVYETSFHVRQAGIKSEIGRVVQ